MLILIIKIKSNFKQTYTRMEHYISSNKMCYLDIIHHKLLFTSSCKAENK